MQKYICKKNHLLNADALIINFGLKKYLLSNVVQTVINFNDLIAIRSCTCRKTPTKLVCKCIQAKSDLDQKEFTNPTLTRNVINGNFERPISFVHADGAFDANGQFQLRRVDSTLSSVESNAELDDEFIHEDEENNDENSIDSNTDSNIDSNNDSNTDSNTDNNIDNLIDENDNCVNDDRIENCMDERNNSIDEIDEDVCMNEDEAVLTDDLVDLSAPKIGQTQSSSRTTRKLTEPNKSAFKFKSQIKQEHVTKLLVKGESAIIENGRSPHDVELDKSDELRSGQTSRPISKNLSAKTSLSLESDDLNSLDECLVNEENCEQLSNKRRVSILKDYAQSTLMTSTSSGISTSSCTSTLNKSGSKDSGQPKILIRCVRLYYSVPYASFNFKIKCINLIPEYLQDNIVITPETIYNSNNEQQTKFTVKNSSMNGLDSPAKYSLNGKFNDFNDSLNTLNSLPTAEADQQRLNMISLMNATSQNRILEQKKIKQFVVFVKDHLQGK